MCCIVIELYGQNPTISIPAVSLAMSAQELMAANLHRRDIRNTGSANHGGGAHAPFHARDGVGVHSVASTKANAPSERRVTDDRAATLLNAQRFETLGVIRCARECARLLAVILKDLQAGLSQLATVLL